MKGWLVIVVLIILIIALLIYSGTLTKEDVVQEYYACRNDSDCPAGVCNGGVCKQCTFDSDCPGTGDYCYFGLCEPGATGRQPCLERETTGNVVVTKYATDFGNNPNTGETCFFFLGSETNAMISQRFSATWSRTAITRAGGFIVTWVSHVESVSGFQINKVLK